jgi:iron complex transport system substrate-binding protein
LRVHATALLRIGVSAALAFALGCGCRPSPSTAPLPAPTTASAGWPRELRDDSGATVTIPAPPKRIVSLAPSNTEILFALGAGDRVVADTFACDYPAEAKSRPHVGAMSAGDLERIQTSFPDLVVAVGSINSKLVAVLRAAHVTTLVVNPHTTAEVLASIRLIGRAIGSDGEADRLSADVQGRIDGVRRLTARATTRPKMLIAYSDKPIYTSPPDSFIHDLIGVAGGDDIVREPLPENIISPAVVIERAPDIIICSPSLRPRLKALPGWSAVPAVKSDRFFATTGDAELTRPGPRLAAAVEQLAHYIHPELFPPAGHEPH